MTNNAYSDAEQPALAVKLSTMRDLVTKAVPGATDVDETVSAIVGEFDARIQEKGLKGTSDEATLFALLVKEVEQIISEGRWQNVGLDGLREHIARIVADHTTLNKNLLRGIIRKHLGPYGDQHVQEVLDKVIDDWWKERARGAFKSASHARAWAARAAHNKAEDTRRRIKRMVSVDAPIQPGNPGRGSFVDAAEDASVVNPRDEADKGLVHELLDLLPERKKRAVHMYFIENMTMEHIAKKLGKSKSTVSEWITSSLVIMRKHLERKRRGS